jgi:nicotinamide mononucleotide transporter
MTIVEIVQQFLADIVHTRWYEYLAVFAGIVSVWFSRVENIWVYPVGLINTIIYVYISLDGSLPGEAAVNCYYTIMSIVGWYKWVQKDTQHHLVLHITNSNRKEWIGQLLFFFSFYIIIFICLTYFKKYFFEGAIPWADALASASAFTGMWLMTRKKTESWIWWIITNITSIPLYFVKHYVLTSIYYLVLLVLAVMGLIEWWKRSNQRQHGT